MIKVCLVDYLYERFKKNCFFYKKYLINYNNINDMSIGNFKKLRLAEGLQKIDVESQREEAKVEDIALVYKDKNQRVKKELSFKTKNVKSKLA